MTASREDHTSRDLVEPEGTNAGSAEPEPAGARVPDVLSGGDPQASTQPMPPRVEQEGLLGPPVQNSDQPGQELAAGEG